MNRTLLPHLLFVTVSLAAYAASNPSAAIRDVRVVANGDKVSVEVDLTESVTPTLTFAKNPDRLIADFPNVSPKQSLQHIPVGKNGVERVRIGLNHSSPPITRVVVDLDSLRPFAVEASDRMVRLNILPASAKGGIEETGSFRPQSDSTSIAELSPRTGVEPNLAPAMEAAAP